MSIVQCPTYLHLATHCHAMVPTRPACHWFEESCQNTAAATTQVHPAPCQSRPSKVKVVERQKQRRTGSDRPAPSAALLCRASSLAPLYQHPRERRGTGMDACPMWPNQSAHAQRPPVAMQRRAPNDLSAFAACHSFKQARAGPSHSRDAMARAVAVLGELAQPQGHCRAPQRATELPGGCIPGRWVRAPRAADKSSIRSTYLSSAFLGHRFLFHAPSSPLGGSSWSAASAARDDAQHAHHTCVARARLPPPFAALLLAMATRCWGQVERRGKLGPSDSKPTLWPGEHGGLRCRSRPFVS